MEAHFGDAFDYAKYGNCAAIYPLSAECGLSKRIPKDEGSTLEQPRPYHAPPTWLKVQFHELNVLIGFLLYQDPQLISNDILGGDCNP